MCQGESKIPLHDKNFIMVPKSAAVWEHHGAGTKEADL